MQYEITTAEAAEVFSITKKTVCEYAKLGIFEKISHGRYDLKKSLVNYIEYQKCIREGYADPWFIWTIRRDERWRREEQEAAHPTPDDDLNDIELAEIEIPKA
jgi:hypothetical protein